MLQIIKSFYEMQYPEAIVVLGLFIIIVIGNVIADCNKANNSCKHSMTTISIEETQSFRCEFEQQDMQVEYMDGRLVVKCICK